MKFVFSVLTTLALAGTCALGQQASQDKVLLDAERQRGVMTGDQGIQWRVDVESTGGGSTPKAAFYAVSQGNRIYADVVAPESAKGRKYLATSDGQMWFWKPSLSRPVSVYRNQRLKGDAAIGDIASTSFVDGYNVVSVEPDTLDGENAMVYTLKYGTGLQLLNNTSGYDKIKYWVVTDSRLGKKAEFYSRSGNLMRTSTMEYENELDGGPFLSKMVVVDSGRTVTLSYSELKKGQYSPALFDKDSLGGAIPSKPKKPAFLRK